MSYSSPQPLPADVTFKKNPEHLQNVCTSNAFDEDKARIVSISALVSA